ncbi:uncharacterized protein LOC132563733 [Ylistrum balloti]|uniref:uncharacterized protein LOC132563733 n=1 Tax=Ylistrum balloti TaxID=509963 RepID=UPI002905C237|nr:uncharacterized protein LOC132563733 [Ylistrum balloti]
MTDEVVASQIYESLLISHTLSVRDFHKKFKNQHLDDNQICRCLKLLSERGLVCVQKKEGMDIWSLPSETDAQPNQENNVSEIGDHSVRRKNEQTSCQQIGSSGHVSNVEQSSSEQLHFSYNLSSRESYAEVTKSKHNSRENTSTFTNTNTRQHWEDDLMFPKPPASTTDNTRQHRVADPLCPQTPASTAGNTKHYRVADPLCPQPPVSTAGNTMKHGREDTMSLAEQQSIECCLTKPLAAMEIVKSGESSVTMYTSSLGPEERICRDDLKKIVDVFKNANSPLKAADVAKKTGIGDTKKCANSWLYFLEKKEITRKLPGAKPLWTLTDKGSAVTDEDVNDIAAEFYIEKNRGSGSSVATIPGRADPRRGIGSSPKKMCKNCNNTCVEEHHYHNHLHIQQMGKENIVFTTTQAVGNPYVENG